MDNLDLVQDAINRDITSIVLKKLVLRTGLTNREICRKCGIAESTLHDWLYGVRTTQYEKLKKISKFLSEYLKDNTITYEYVCLGSDEDRKRAEENFEAYKVKVEKDLNEAAWKEFELKSQLDMFRARA